MALPKQDHRARLPPGSQAAGHQAGLHTLEASRLRGASLYRGCFDSEGWTRTSDTGLMGPDLPTDLPHHRDFGLCRAFTDALLVQSKVTMALLQQDPCARVRLRGGVSPLVHLFGSDRLPEGARRMTRCCISALRLRGGNSPSRHIPGLIPSPVCHRRRNSCPREGRLLPFQAQ